MNYETQLFFEVVRRRIQDVCDAHSLACLVSEAVWSGNVRGARIELPACTIEIVRDHVLDRLDASVSGHEQSKVDLDQILALNAWKRGQVGRAIVSEAPSEAAYQKAVESTISEIEQGLGSLAKISEKSLKIFGCEYQQFVDES